MIEGLRKTDVLPMCYSGIERRCCTQLVTGTAEVFGTELVEGQAYRFTSSNVVSVCGVVGHHHLAVTS
jgi:hypothetical protein